MSEQVFLGDCLDILDKIDRESVDVVYIDPPFFTQTVHRLVTRDGEKSFSFADVWDNDNSYADFIFRRITKVREKLKPTGSIFFHCDKSASHIIRLLLDSVFGEENFRSEIIWYFRRWSNSKRGLLNSHQTIYFYSKGGNFKFFPAYQGYSPSTNVDQIMQKRSRDHRNKSIYARGDNGEVISNGTKKGVPLGDVWEIPFLNPKAKERVGYPTQKPILLIKQIIELTTELGDVVLDPFCGSGTALVAAQLLGRKTIGIDISKEAVELTKSRIKEPIVTQSALMEKGREAYETHDREAAAHLVGIDYTPIQRNKGMDGLLKQEVDGRPVFIRVQRSFETQEEAAAALMKACKNKGDCLRVVVATRHNLIPRQQCNDVVFVRSTCLSFTNLEEEIRGSNRHRVHSAG